MGPRKTCLTGQPERRPQDFYVLFAQCPTADDWSRQPVGSRGRTTIYRSTSAPLYALPAPPAWQEGASCVRRFDPAVAALDKRWRRAGKPPKATRIAPAN